MALTGLELFKEDARQFNEAKLKGKMLKKAIIEYVDCTGKRHLRFWNGATYTDKRASLYDREFKGTYQVKFKMPR